MRKPRLLVFLLSSITSIVSAAVIEEVVVTADFRNNNESDTASSISIVNEEYIRATSAQHLDDVINAIPNLNFASGTSRARFFQIRGIGERSQFGSPLNPSVGYIVDNVDFSGTGSIGTLIDVQQVEVLRGPQGTRYGANALAGLINLKTNDPTDQSSAQIKLTAAEYDHRTISVILNQPLTDAISSRLAVERHKSSGYYDNDFLGSDDTNKRDELTVRGKLKVDLSADWQLSLALSKIDIDNGYDTFSLDNSRTTFSDQPGRDSQNSTSFSLQSDWAAESFDLQLILAAASSDIQYSYDEDWTFAGFHPDGYSSFDSYQRDKDIASFETRVISNHKSRIFNDSTDWLVGFYHLSSKEDLLRQYTFLAENFSSDYDFKTTAFFIQLDSELSDQWSASFGGRVERRETEYENSDGLDVDPDDTLWGGRISLKRLFDNDTLLYLSLARGYKASGFNTDGTLDPSLREFDSELLWEIETGIKSNLLSDSLRLRIAVFYDKRQDQQVKSSFVQQRADGSSEFVDFLGNAAKGTNAGFEVETLWFVTDSVNLTANVGVLRAEFDDFINEFGEDLSGRDQSQAPSYSYRLAFNWHNENWFADIGVNGKDEFFFSDRHSLQSKKYSLLNASLAYDTGTMRISLWGRNLTDKDYTVRGFGSFGNDPRKGYVTEPYVQFGEPRIVGVSFEFKMGDR